ncbi:phage terminase large subunit [bacterium 210820-DFI.6.37]|nr:phage terminase large subunit [bacterium 210820-DFI.6.37]
MPKLTPQEVYLKKVQTDYKAYCFHVHNHGLDAPAWIPSRFHTFLCDTIQDFVEEETDKAFEILIINTPPQHGKSTTVTETYPAFFLSRNPTKKAIIISYGDDLAERFGKRNLEKIRSYGNLFGVSLNKKKSTAREFELSNEKGRMISKGLGAGITGHSGDLILIDDPIKNRTEADSETTRNRVWGEFEDTVKSRTSAGAKIVLIMTRWHEDDLAGRIMKEFEDRTTIINLPCEAEENDLLGRERGQALCPEIGKGDNWLKDFKRTFTSEQGVRSWNALYQGRPSSAEGNIIKREWWKYYSYKDYAEGRLIFDNMLMSVDATFKDQEKNDFVAIEVWGKKRADKYLVDLINEHLDFPNTVRAILGMKAMHPFVGAILVEDKANGSAIIQVMRSQIPGIIAVEPIGGKEARVNSVSPAIESGNCYLPNDRAFTGMFVDQCASFPNGKNDDMVDSMSQALARLIFISAKGKIPQKPKGDWDFATKPKRVGTGKGEKIHVI